MTLLKAHNSFLKANGKIIKSESIINELLFLTYFDDFNNDTKIDKPLVGPDCLYSGDGQSYTLSSLNLFNSTVNSIYNTYKNSDYRKFIIDEPIPSNVKFISSEMFVLCQGTRYDFGSSITFGCLILVLDPYFSSSEFLISTPSIDNLEHTLYNGTRYSNYGSYGCGTAGIDIRYKLSHIASVYDVENKKLRYYIDGNIMLELRNKEIEKYQLKFGQFNTGKSFNITGIAIWAKDMSINDGMNYPVPTRRYA